MPVSLSVNVKDDEVRSVMVPLVASETTLVTAEIKATTILVTLVIPEVAAGGTSVMVPQVTLVTAEFELTSTTVQQVTLVTPEVVNELVNAASLPMVSVPDNCPGTSLDKSVPSSAMVDEPTSI